MFKGLTYKQIYAGLLDDMKKKKARGIESVKRAFEMAEKCHEGQFRKSGEPYVLHVVCVASILQKLNFDSDTICAALLHDVIEDCGVTVDEITEKFGSIVAGIVDAVSAIEAKDYVFDDDLFDDENNLKASVENKTFEKLLSMGMKNRLAFVIKFADRLHNLSTIEAFTRAKQLEKVKETERWILPLAKLIKSAYFYNNIKNQIFIIKNREELSNFFEASDLYYSLNSDSHKEVEEILRYNAEKVIKRYKYKTNKVAIVCEKNQEVHVCHDILSSVDIDGLEEIKLSHINKVPTINLYLNIWGKMDKKTCMDLLLNIFKENEVKDKLKITGCRMDNKFHVGYIIAKDNNRNKYKIAAMNMTDYTKFTNGSAFGTDIENIQTTEVTEVASEYINVYTKTGELIRMEKNSTVLDFAFRLHQDLGFSCKHAIINKSNTKQPLYTRLFDGDKIDLVLEIDEQTGEKKNIAKLRWLAYVKTDYAQKALIRYFEKQLAK